jgi:hypothetical protein
MNMFTWIKQALFPKPRPLERPVDTCSEHSCESMSLLISGN